MKRKTKRSAFLAVLALTCAFTGLAFGGCGGSQEPVRSIQSVEKTATNGLVDTYTILFTDGTTSTFELTNGEDGDAGVGIANVEINYKGEVVVELENGKKYTVTVTSPSCNFVPVVTSPTCGEQGYTTYTCTDCGFSYINNYVAPTGHHYIDKYCTFCKEEQPFGTIAYETDWYDSSQSTFELSTKEQLAGLAYLVNNGNDFSGKTIKLPNDVDLASQSWVPIGTSSNAFKGTFDGQNFKIKNLCIDADYSYVGFFGYATGAIKRVEIAGANISVSGENSYVGALCGYASSSISEVKVSGYVNAPDCNYVGGILGGISTGAIDLTYTDLSNSANVNGNNYVGGLIGELYNSYDAYSSKSVAFKASNNSGKVEGNDYVGGLYGRVYVNNTRDNYSISFSSFDNKNTGNVTGAYNVGGIFGWVQAENVSTLKNSQSSAEITGTAYVGGLIGYSERVSVDSCVNTGSKVVANGYEIADGGDYRTYLGGFVGRGYGASNCVNEVELVYDLDGRYIGGIAGFTTNSVTDCSNTANVKAENSSYVGGIVGGISTGAIDLTYTDLSNSANISGNDYVGGLIGELYNSYDAYSSKSVAFKASNNSGKVEGNDYVGGLYGRVYVNNTRDNYSISFSSFDNKNTGNVTGAYYVGGIFGYVYAENESTLKNSQSSAEITGTAYVGGLIGYSERVSVDSCVNTGSKVAANGYEIADGGDYYTYLGGFVGRGYGASNCVNEVELVYDLDGRYIGGIAGFATNSVTDCSNTANVKAENSSYVGGIIGGMSTGAIDLTYTNLSNSANISGNDYIGGLIGELYNSYDAYSNRNVALTLSNNVGKVEGNDYVGGLYGRVYVNNTKGDYSISFSSFDNKNTGNVTGAYYVGGIFGYVYAENESALKNSQSSAEITGTAYVGGLIGYSERVSVDSCVNTGSEVVANGYEIADGGDYRTYLGGFVGRGYGASNCVNEVELVYDLDGRYIGGIAGLATNSVTDCSNTTNVKAENSCNVGGLVGCISAGAINITCTNLSNSGDIKGEDYVGGLIGEIISSYDAWSSRTLTLTLSNNSGKVEGNNYVAGLYGYVYANNSKGDYGISLVTFDNTNTGDVTGIEYVGGIAGYICVEWGYTVETTRFSNTGTITAGAEAVYYGELFGENKSITLT